VKVVPIETVFYSVWGAILLTIVCCALFDKHTTSSDSDPQRYTVHFDGIDYQDLTRDFHGLSRSRSAYKTRVGKRIEFHGSFYEVEQ
jgi:hypothetical protein